MCIFVMVKLLHAVDWVHFMVGDVQQISIINKIYKTFCNVNNVNFYKAAQI